MRKVIKTKPHESPRCVPPLSLRLKTHSGQSVQSIHPPTSTSSSSSYTSPTVRFCAHTCFVPQTFHRFRIVAAKYASSSMHALRSAKYWQNVLNPIADGFRPPLSNAVKK